MISRHKIRQCVVQFLYGIGYDYAGTFSTDSLEAFWDVMLESEKRSQLRAMISSIQHFARPQAQRFTAFCERMDKAFETLSKYTETEEIRDALSDIRRREEAWKELLRLIQMEAARDPDLEKQEIHRALDAFNEANATLMQLRARAMMKLKDERRFSNAVAPVIAALEKLQMGALHVDELFNLENHQDAPHLSPVLKPQQDMASLKKQAGEMICAIMRQLDVLDDTIEAQVQNYAPERIAPMERAVLRLGIYELKETPSVPVPVIVAEAIKLAEEYSGKEAAKFLNGVLGQLAPQLRTGE